MNPLLWFLDDGPPTKLLVPPWRACRVERGGTEAIDNFAIVRCHVQDDGMNEFDTLEDGEIMTRVTNRIPPDRGCYVVHKWYIATIETRKNDRAKAFGGHYARDSKTQ